MEFVFLYIILFLMGNSCLMNKIFQEHVYCVIRGQSVSLCTGNYILSLLLFLTYNKDKFKLNSDVYNTNSYHHNRPWRPTGLRDVKDNTVYRQLACRWRQGCQPYAPAALYSSETLLFCLWYSFLLEAE
jgi:hypothetical protein